MMCKQVMRKAQIIRLLLIALTLVFMTSGCGSDSGGKNTIEDIVVPGNLTRDASYFGSWIASPTHHGCTYTSLITFSDDGTYSGTESGGCEDDGAHTTNGTWGITEDGRMYMDSATDSDGYLYAFLTSTGKLSMNDSDSSDVLKRDGEGTGLVGTWITEDEDCTDTLTFTATAFTYDQTCTDPEDEEDMEGTYTVAGDIITVMIEGEVVDQPFFKIFNNSVLSLDYEDQLYSEQNE